MYDARTATHTTPNKPLSRACLHPTSHGRALRTLHAIVSALYLSKVVVQEVVKIVEVEKVMFATLPYTLIRSRC